MSIQLKRLMALSHSVVIVGLLPLAPQSLELSTVRPSLIDRMEHARNLVVEHLPWDSLGPSSTAHPSVFAHRR